MGAGASRQGVCLSYVSGRGPDVEPELPSSATTSTPALDLPHGDIMGEASFDGLQGGVGRQLEREIVPQVHPTKPLGITGSTPACENCQHKGQAGGRSFPSAVTGWWVPYRTHCRLCPCERGSGLATLLPHRVVA